MRFRRAPHLARGYLLTTGLAATKACALLLADLVGREAGKNLKEQFV